MEEYYQLFPAEKAEYSSEITEMYYGTNIRERCLYLLKPLARQTGAIPEKSVELANDIIVSCLRTLLEEKCQDPSLDPGDMTTRLLSMLHYVVNL
ncbi:hypothetical protein [Merdimonas faecis]